MAKHILFLVHGVGRKTESLVGEDETCEWAKKVVEILETAAAAYTDLDRDDLVIVPVLYDDIFFTYATNWDALADQLTDTPFSDLTDWMRDANEKGFLWDNIGDVVMYRGLKQIRQNVITHVAAQLGEVIEKYGVTANYSVLAHSLGTAVAHDTLQKLATTGINGNTSMKPPGFRLANFFALANVSRLVWATNDDFYSDTCVRPDGSGLDAEKCAVNRYVNFRHVADPIPSIIRFSPAGWNQNRYWSLPLQHVRDPDVHAFTHYLLNPKVSDLVLESMFGQTIIDQSIREARIQGFPDYEGSTAQFQKATVQAIGATLDVVSGNNSGALGDTFKEIIKQLFDSRDKIANELARLS